MITKACNVALMGFRRWGANIRYPLLLVLLFIFLWWILEPIKTMCYTTGYATNLFILPFVISAESSQLIILAGALFLYANAPFSDEMQLFVMFRTGRLPWVLGQVFYILGSAAIYVTIIFLFSAIIIAPVATLNADGWGTIVNTLAYTNAGSAIHLGFPVSEKVIVSLTPVAALGLQLLLEFLCVAILGLVVFLINLVSPLKIGLFVGGLLALFDLLVTNIMPSVFFGVSPASLSRFSILDFNGTNPFLPDVEWALSFDVCVLLVLCIAALTFSKRVNIETTPDL